MNTETAAVTNQPLPWQLGLWQQIRQQHTQGRLAHALLITGPAGCGQDLFSEALAHYVLCQRPEEYACGQCKACLLLAQGTHPDRVTVAPLEAGKAIKVDQIRELTQFIGSSSQQGGYRVIEVSPADDLNINAANALLKGLEEPGRRTLFILRSHRPGRVLPTVRSRCQQYSLGLPPADEASAWLAQHLPDTEDAELLLRLAGGAPITALTMYNSQALEARERRFAALEAVIRRQASVSTVAANWIKDDLLGNLEWLGLITADLIRLRMVGATDDLRNPDAQASLRKLAELTTNEKLFEFRDKIHQYRVHVMRRSNPNQQLLWEDLLVQWRTLFSRP